MKYKFLLFDADGTLFNYDKAEILSLEQTFNYFNLEFDLSYIEVYRLINHQLWLEYEKGCVSTDVLKVKRFYLLFEKINIQVNLQLFSDQYLYYMANTTYLIDNALEVIQALHKQYQLILVTNGLKDVQRSRFEKSAIRKYFTKSIISEEVGAAKPDKVFFDAVFHLLGNPARSDVLIIGDGLSSDIQGGHNYNIDTCWFNPKNTPYNINFKSIYEIASLLELLQILNCPAVL